MTNKNTKILTTLHKIMAAHRDGRLGGEQMPEDVHPDFPRDSKELTHYLTLPMALNYQRNSYALWQAATATFNNPSVSWVFDPQTVITKSEDALRVALLKYKVALQPNKHIATWQRLSHTFANDFDCDARNIIIQHHGDIAAIKAHIQAHKKDFPYLGGPKICNYWLYVLTQYTALPFTNRNALSVAPDTHVINASVRLGVIDANKKPEDVAHAWQKILTQTDLSPIDIHTPLWLWSRSGFPDMA